MFNLKKITMRKIFTITALIILVSMSVKAQWMPQATGFPQPSVGINYISAVNQNVLWAIGYDGSGGTALMQSFTKTTDGGTTWTAGTISGFTTYEPSMICAIDANTAWVPLFTSNSLGGVLVKTTDGGATWTQQNTAAFAAPDGFPNVVHFWDADNGFCMGDPMGGYFEIYTTTNGGTTWARTPQANIPAILSGEFGVVGYYSVVGNTIWYGTNKGRVYKSVDKGLNWTVSVTSFSNHYVDVDFLTQTYGIAREMGTGTGTITGQLCETMDGGTTWTSIPLPTLMYTSGFSWVPGTPNYCVTTGSAATASGAAFSFNGGHTWTDFDATSGVQFLHTAWVDNSNGWAGAFTDQTTPSTVGGMYKYGGVLTDIMQIDPKQGDVKVYPNPSNGNLTFAIVGFENKDVTVSIFNSLGQAVYSNVCKENLISYNYNADLSSFSSGVYFAKIQCGKKIINQKLVIE